MLLLDESLENIVSNTSSQPHNYDFYFMNEEVILKHLYSEEAIILSEAEEAKLEGDLEKFIADIKDEIEDIRSHEGKKLKYVKIVQIISLGVNLTALVVGLVSPKKRIITLAIQVIALLIQFIHLCLQGILQGNISSKLSNLKTRVRTMKERTKDERLKNKLDDLLDVIEDSRNRVNSGLDM